MANTAPARPAFVRDRFTVTAYLLLGYFAYTQSLLGPLMPFLRDELGLSYVTGSLHLSAFAAGMVLVGVLGDAALARLGFRAALWGGGLGMAACAIALVLGRDVALTIPATAVMGVLGALMLVTQQAALGHHHGPRRAIAFTEGNIFASLCSMLAPLAVGAAVSAGLSWRPAMLVAVPLFGALLLREWRRPVPEPARSPGERPSGRLPARFWAFWSVSCLGVAVEWSMGFWGADYMHTVGGLPIELAVTAMSLFFLMMLLGRVASSALARRYPPALLLIGTMAIALAGVLLLRAASGSAPLLLGIAVSGLGIGSLFPMALSVATATAPDLAAAASARMTLAGGLAILLAPLALGGLADQIGLAGAFAIVPALLVAALAIAVAAQVIGARREA